MKRKISIWGCGAVSSVGLNSIQTYTSVSSGISRFTETNIHNKRFQPIVMATLPNTVLEPLKSEIYQHQIINTRKQRILQLAGMALTDLNDNVKNIFSCHCPVYIGVAEQKPDIDFSASSAFFEYLKIQSGLDFNTEKSRLFPSGKASFFQAVNEAVSEIKKGNEQNIIVGAVDSFMDLMLLDSLDLEDRIMGDGVMDGFIPGEGAGFLLIGEQPETNSHFVEMAAIDAVATGFEAGHRYSDEIYRGDGLASTFQTLFSDMEDSVKINTVFAGFNGENHNAKEWGVAYLRNSDRFLEEYTIEHPADCFGDIGAALGSVMTAISAIMIKEKQVEGPNLIWCSSDYGTIGALVVSK